jgi:hypothetical protein
VQILILLCTATTGRHLTGQPGPGLLTAAALVALALAAAGAAITAIIPSAQAAQPVLMHVYLLLILPSGGFGVIAELPSAVSTTMTHLPLQAADRRRDAHAGARPRRPHASPQPGGARRMGGKLPAGRPLVLQVGPAPCKRGTVREAPVPVRRLIKSERLTFLMLRCTFVCDERRGPWWICDERHSAARRDLLRAALSRGLAWTGDARRRSV